MSTVGGPANGAAGGSVGTPPIGSVGGPTGASGTGVSTGVAPAVADGVPCAVANVVTNNCTGCHSSPMLYSAPMPLMKLADFHAAAKSNSARKVFEVIPERINATNIAMRMPPSAQAALAMADLKTLNDWVVAGAQASGQSCAIVAKDLPGTTTAKGSAGSGSNMTTGSAGGAAPPPGTHLGGANDMPIEYNDPNMKCYQFLAHDPGSKTTPYTVDTTPDRYTNFMFMPEWQGMMYARAYKIIYGNKQVIHHWLFYKDMAAGTDGDISPSSGAHPDGELVHGWAPGGSELWLDPDVGVEMPSDVAYTLETHHNNTTGVSAPDASGIEICVTPTVPTHVASLSWLGTDAISGTEASGTCTPTNTEPIHVIGDQPHMHVTGIRMTAEIMRAGGMTEMLHDAPFDFQNQHSYREPTIIMPGDSITTTCYYNAPASFGERTSDEMCYFFTLYYPKFSLTNQNPIWSTLHGPNTCLGP
jgi:hypothetical protein